MIIIIVVSAPSPAGTKKDVNVVQVVLNPGPKEAPFFIKDNKDNKGQPLCFSCL